MTGIPVVVMAFALLAGCQALPLNESYDCLTDDACEKINNSTRASFNNKLYCCKSGDGIRINSKAFAFYSSGGHTSNLTSDQSVDNTDASKQEGPKDVDIKRNYNFTCKCGDKQKIEDEISKSFNEMLQQFYDMFNFPWFF